MKNDFKNKIKQPPVVLGLALMAVVGMDAMPVKASTMNKNKTTMTNTMERTEQSVQNTMEQMFNFKPRIQSSNKPIIPQSPPSQFSTNIRTKPIFMGTNIFIISGNNKIQRIPGCKGLTGSQGPSGSNPYPPPPSNGGTGPVCSSVLPSSQCGCKSNVPLTLNKPPLPPPPPPPPPPPSRCHSSNPVCKPAGYGTFSWPRYVQELALNRGSEHTYTFLNGILAPSNSNSNSPIVLSPNPFYYHHLTVNLPFFYANQNHSKVITFLPAQSFATNMTKLYTSLYNSKIYSLYPGNNSVIPFVPIGKAVWVHQEHSSSCFGLCNNSGNSPLQVNIYSQLPQQGFNTYFVTQTNAIRRYPIRFVESYPSQYNILNTGNNKVIKPSRITDYGDYGDVNFLRYVDFLRHGDLPKALNISFPSKNKVRQLLYHSMYCQYINHYNSMQCINKYISATGSINRILARVTEKPSVDNPYTRLVGWYSINKSYNPLIHQNPITPGSDLLFKAYSCYFMTDLYCSSEYYSITNVQVHSYTSSHIYKTLKYSVPVNPVAPLP